MSRYNLRCALLATVAIVVQTAAAKAQAFDYFTPGDIVISTLANQVGGTAANSANSGGNGLDTASPITLYELTAAVTNNGANVVGSLTLPQTSSGSNYAISGEYGSASEGILQQSANGQLLTMMGYGVTANSFNNAINNSTAVGTFGTTALGQTNSLTSQSVQTVARVVAAIGTGGQVDTSTAVTGVFNTNNPRSAATVDGTLFYIGGQGVTGDSTGGVFMVRDGASTATSINISSTASNVSTAPATLGTEVRAVEIVNTGSGNTLQVSRDFKPSGASNPNDATDIRTLTNANGGLPTSATGLVATRDINLSTATVGGNTLGGNFGTINLTAALANGVNNSRIGTFVYLSPEQFYYANATTLYVADSGSPKNGNAGKAALGEGGLQKWSLIGGIWVLDYDIYLGLNLVNNGNANSATNTVAGVTGLFGLACEVVGVNVQCYATSYGLNELSQSYVYEVSDNLANTYAAIGAAETFTTVYTAQLGTNIRGVAFAPVPEPMSLALFGVGLAGIGTVARRRRG